MFPDFVGRPVAVLVACVAFACAGSARAEALRWHEAEASVEAAADEAPASARLRALREARRRLAEGRGGVLLQEELLVRSTSASAGAAPAASIAVRRLAQRALARIVEEEVVGEGVVPRAGSGGFAYRVRLRAR